MCIAWFLRKLWNNTLLYNLRELLWFIWFLWMFSEQNIFIYVFHMYSMISSFFHINWWLFFLNIIIFFFWCWQKSKQSYTYLKCALHIFVNLRMFHVTFNKYCKLYGGIYLFRNINICNVNFKSVGGFTRLFI